MALNALQNDKSATVVVRECSEYCLVRDAGNAALRKMDVPLNQSPCCPTHAADQLAARTEPPTFTGGGGSWPLVRRDF